MIKALIQRWLNSKGFDIVRYATSLTPQELAKLQKVRGLTAAGLGRNAGLMDAINYIVTNKIDGAVVECGVWRGGSVMLAAYTLLELGDISRDLFLFDTFEGMAPPSEKDVMFDGTTARQVLDTAEPKEGEDNYWCVATVDSVRKNVLSTGYPADRVHLVKGKVEETLPQHA